MWRQDGVSFSDALEKKSYLQSLQFFVDREMLDMLGLLGIPSASMA